LSFCLINIKKNILAQQMGQTQTKLQDFAPTQKNLNLEKDEFKKNKIQYLSLNGMEKYMNGKNKPCVVAATAEWCSHCKNLRPVLDDLRSKKKSYNVALFNAYKHRENKDIGNLGKDQIGIKIDDAIKGYPTIFFFDGNGTAAVYDGDRNAKDINKAMKIFLKI